LLGEHFSLITLQSPSSVVSVGREVDQLFVDLLQVRLRCLIVEVQPSSGAVIAFSALTQVQFVLEVAVPGSHLHVDRRTVVFLVADRAVGYVLHYPRALVADVELGGRHLDIALGSFVRTDLLRQEFATAGLRLAVIGPFGQLGFVLLDLFFLSSFGLEHGEQVVDLVQDVDFVVDAPFVFSGPFDEARDDSLQAFVGERFVRAHDLLQHRYRLLHVLYHVWPVHGAQADADSLGLEHVPVCGVIPVRAMGVCLVLGELSALLVFLGSGVVVGVAPFSVLSFAAGAGCLSEAALFARACASYVAHYPRLVQRTSFLSLITCFFRHSLFVFATFTFTFSC